MFLKKILIFPLLVLFFSQSYLGAEWTELERTGPKDSQDTFTDQFDRLSVSGAIDVVLSNSKQTQIVIKGPPNLIKKIHVEIENQVATVHYNENSFFNLKSFKGERVQALVSSPDLKQIKIKGSGTLKSEGALKFSQLLINKSGSGRIDLNLTTDELRMDLKGSVRATLEGSSEHLTLISIGSSRFYGKNFNVENADVLLKGSSKIELHANKNLKVHISGSAHLRYSGNPELSLNKVGGSSSVKPM